MRIPVILCVDDLSSTHDLVEIFLGDSYSVINAHSGTEAIDIMHRQQNIDLILLDQCMGEIDGITTLLTLKRFNIELPPVIMMTAHESVTLAVTFMQSGGTDFISKPLDAELLRIRVSNSLQNRLQVKQLKRLMQATQSSQIIESMGLLSGGVCEDINNKLLGILDRSKDAASLIKTYLGSPEANTFTTAAAVSPLKAAMQKLGDIEALSEHISELGNQLRRYGQPDENIERSEVDITESVKDTITLLRHSTLGKTIIDIDCKQNGKINANPIHIQQIVLNLCLNATESMTINLEKENLIKLVIDTFEPSDVYYSIHPNLGRHKSMIEISVIDNGCGIHEEVRSNIFDPFFTTKVHDNHIGLGLSLVKKLVQQLGGVIEIKSRLDHGSTFTVQLPCTKVDSSISSTAAA